MKNCSKDIRAYHDKKVNLPQDERDNMRERRDSNRDRLRNGLEKADKPSPKKFRSQGSYAMKTMTQDDDKDYDIDDGVYFDKADLTGPNDGEMTSLQTRNMVRDAVDDDRFDKEPEVRSNCVRVYYKEGYHVDLPLYRKIVEINDFEEEEVYYELASSSGWKRSDAQDVTKWYEDALRNSGNSSQLRRITRVLKKFARSRSSWRSSILCGFGISVLAVECFRSNDREDLALYETIIAIRNRLNGNLQIEHPVTPNEYITRGFDDAQARLFREKLTYAINKLEPLLQDDCSREEALKCWDKVFDTTFFSERIENEENASQSVSTPISSSTIISVTSNSDHAVRDTGGGRYA